MQKKYCGLRPGNNVDFLFLLIWLKHNFLGLGTKRAKWMENWNWMNATLKQSLRVTSRTEVVSVRTVGLWGPSTGQHITWLLHNSRSVGLILCRWRQEGGIKERENNREGGGENKAGGKKEKKDRRRDSGNLFSHRRQVGKSKCCKIIHVELDGVTGGRKWEEGHLLLQIIRPRARGKYGLITL